MKHYQPIDCNFHDIILDRITRKSVCTIEFGENGKLSNFRGLIKNVFSKSGEEYLVLDDQNTIRLDRIKSLDGIFLNAKETINGNFNS